MKIISLYILAITLLITSSTSYSIAPARRLDTSKPISSKIVIFVSPTIDEIDKIKANAKNIEDFYILADDVNYYSYEAEELLKKKNIPYKLTDNKKLKFIINNKIIEIDYSKSEQDWFVLIYNGKDKPTKTYAIDIDEHEALLKQLTEPTSAPTPLPH